MAISRVGSAQAASAASGGDITLTFDVTPSEDDVVIVFAGVTADRASYEPIPTGYTRIINASNTGDTYAEGTWSYKVMTSTPDTSVTIPGSGNAADGQVAIAYVLRGVDTTNVVDVAGASANGALDVEGNPDPPSITPITDGAWVFTSHVMNNPNEATQPPSGYGDFAKANGVDTNRCVGACAGHVIETAAATDPGTFSANGAWSADTQDWTAFSIAIRPSTADDGAPTISGTFTGTAETATTMNTGSVTNNDGDLLVVVASIKVDEINSASISDTAGLTWTEQITDTGAGQHNARVWTAPADGTTTTVTVSGWTTASDGVIICDVVEGTDQTVGATGSNFASGNTKQITTTITTDDPGNLLLAYHFGNTAVKVGPGLFRDGAEVITGGTTGDRVVAESVSRISSGGVDDHFWGDDTSFRSNRNSLAIEVVASVAGAGASETVTDDLGLADSVAETTAFNVAPTDSLGLDDSATQEGAASETVTDGLGLADSVNDVAAYDGAATDTVGLADSVDDVVAYDEGVTDGLGLDDSAAQAGVASEAVADDLGLADSAGAVVGYDGAATDTVGLSDSAEETAAFDGTPTDGVGLADSVDDAVTYDGAVTDGLGLDDSAVYADDAVTATDEVGLSDAVSVGVAYGEGVTDGLGLDDTTTQAGDAVRSTSDTLSLSDALTVLAAFQASATDSLGLSDNVGNVAAYAESANDSASLGDTVAATAAFAASVTDGLGIGDDLRMLGAEIDLAGPFTAVWSTPDRLAVFIPPNRSAEFE